MKKIAFALQVFTLMAILPIYVIVEMNHTTVTHTKNNGVTKLTEGVKTIPTAYHTNKGLQNENVVSRYIDRQTLPTEIFSLTKN
jgi:hypothetical protein